MQRDRELTASSIIKRRWEHAMQRSCVYLSVFYYCKYDFHINGRTSLRPASSSAWSITAKYACYSINIH